MSSHSHNILYLYKHLISHTQNISHFFARDCTQLDRRQILNMKTVAFALCISSMNQFVNMSKAYVTRPAIKITTAATATAPSSSTSSHLFMSTNANANPPSLLPAYGTPSYGLTKKLPSGTTFPQAVTQVTEALKQNGFGVLTEIDMRATMQKKLNVDLGRPYTILGACNPKLALNALQSSPAVGLFLPCNVAVLEDPDGSMVVSIVSPEEMFSIAAKEDGTSSGVESLAKEVQEIMNKVISSL